MLNGKSTKCGSPYGPQYQYTQTLPIYILLELAWSYVLKRSVEVTLSGKVCPGKNICAKAFEVVTRWC